MEHIENIEFVNRRKHIEYDSYRDYVIKTKYNLNYYHTTKIQMNCPICNKKTFDRFLIQHQKSMKCRLKALEQLQNIN